MPIFLTCDQIYRILQRESPQFVYPDGSPSAFFSTADMYSVAVCAASAYSNQQVIYANMFPQTANENIADWEIKVFGAPQDSSQTLAQRQTNILTKLRAQPNLSLYYILTQILPYFPAGTPVQLWQTYKQSGWRLGVSLLGYNTYLGQIPVFVSPGYNYCHPNLGNGWRLGHGNLGVNTILGDYGADFTPNQWFLMQWQAFSYTVRVFGYTMPASVKAAVDALLTKIEPARSLHTFADGLTLSQYGLLYEQTDVEPITDLDCLFLDNASSTGLSGWSATP